MGANYVLLERITVGAAGAASVTFQNIPQTGYTDLKVVVSARSARTNDAGGSDGKLEFNGVTTGYSAKMLLQQGGAYSGTSSTLFYFVNSNNSTSNTFGNMEVYIPNYTSSNYKSVSIDAVDENNASSAYGVMTAGLWSNTAAITSAKFTDNNGGYLQYSTFSLYALAAVGTTPALLPFASGGDIIQNDGTYWYHAFLSSGSFTPAKALSCDVLVVAGGGGGGLGAGGGGAGGVVAFSSQALTANTALTATVGAGGGSLSSYANSNNGSNSQLGSLTPASVGGGGGGGYNGSAYVSGNSGGSGGGSGWGIGGTGGTGTSGQGNNGALGYQLSGGSSSRNGGAGGGAGSAPSNGVSGTASAGGAGVNTYSAWLSATGLGVSGYIAGGGGGGGDAGSTGGAGGSGGGGAGGAGSGANGTSATSNTGSGGGGGGGISGAGGSGLIIVRYAMV